MSKVWLMGTYGVRLRLGSLEKHGFCKLETARTNF